MEIKSILNQNNTLKEIGDNIIIKTPLPIKPNEILVIGYDVITTDIIDLVDWIAGFYYISPVSENLQSLNNIKWVLLEKDKNGINEEFQERCKQQNEPYYIYFKFEKFQSNGQPITITKVNLKIKDFVDKGGESTEKENQNSSVYSRSIFSEIPLNSTDVEKWSYNVLDKIKDVGILPSYIERNKDFSLFWGWITNFFSIIVNFGRIFQNIFNVSEENIHYIGEFLKQRGYLKDSRVNILEKIKINNSKEIIYFPLINKDLDNKGSQVDKNGQINTGFLSIGKASRLFIKLGGYSNSLNEFDKFCVNNTTIKIGYYLSNLQNLRIVSLNLNKNQMKEGINLRINPFDNIKYISISYPNDLGGTNIFYFRVFIDSIGEYNIENKNIENLFNIQKSFKDRGGIKSEDLIKQILETKNEDGFYSNYLPTSNVGWFLNKNYPLNYQLIEPLKLDSFLPESKEDFQNGTLIKFSKKFVFLNQYTSLKISQKNSTDIKDIYSFFNFISDKGNVYSQKDVVFGNWSKDEDNNKIYKSNIYKGIVQKNKKQGSLDVELPIILTQDKRYTIFPTNEYNLINQELYVISKNIINENSGNILDSLKYIQLNYLYVSKNTNPYNKNSLLLDIQVNKEAEYSLNFSKEGNKIYYNFSSSLSENKKEEFHFEEEDKLRGFKILTISDNFKILIKYSDNEELLLNTGLANSHFQKTEENSNLISLNDLKVNLYLRDLPMQLGFLNIQKYILCYYNNNGIYSEDEIKDIIDRKILPYNGFRIFINNNNFRDELFKKLELKNLEIFRHSEDLGSLVIKFKGGIVPYTYTLTKINEENTNTIIINKSKSFNNSLNLKNLSYGKYNISIKDSLGDEINENFNLNSYNKIDYKIKIGIDIEGNLNINLFIWGGNESLYNVSYIDKEGNIKNQYISAKIWTELSPMSIDTIVSKNNTNILIVDSDINWLSKIINLASLLKNSAIEVYDNNEGNCFLID